MTAVKNNGILKRLGALVMALGLTCALAVSASAVEAESLPAGAEFTPVLTVDASVPHDLDFFVDDIATVQDDGKTVIATLKDPATVTVTLPTGVSYSATGSISSASPSDATAGYDIYLDGDDLVVVAPEGTTVETFAPVIRFTVNIISTGGEVTQHQVVDATLTLE